MVVVCVCVFVMRACVRSSVRACVRVRASVRVRLCVVGIRVVCSYIGNAASGLAAPYVVHGGGTHRGDAVADGAHARSHK